LGKEGRLAEGSPESGVLDTELIDQRTTLFPATIGLIGGLERSIEQLGPGFEVFDMPVNRGVSDGGQSLLLSAALTDLDVL